jgi:hypothetical protein
MAIYFYYFAFNSGMPDSFFKEMILKNNRSGENINSEKKDPGIEKLIFLFPVVWKNLKILLSINCRRRSFFY